VEPRNVNMDSLLQLLQQLLLQMPHPKVSMKVAHRSLHLPLQGSASVRPLTSGNLGTPDIRVGLLHPNWLLVTYMPLCPGLRVLGGHPM